MIVLCVSKSEAANEATYVEEELEFVGLLTGQVSVPASLNTRQVPMLTTLAPNQRAAQSMTTLITLP